MQRNLILLIIGMVLFSCKPEGNYPEVPYDIIKPDKMIEIMIDIHIIESYFVTKGINKDSTSTLPVSYYKYVVESHDTDLKTFSKSLQYYLNHAHIFYDMYAEVSEKLSEMEAKTRE